MVEQQVREGNGKSREWLLWDGHSLTKRSEQELGGSGDEEDKNELSYEQRWVVVKEIISYP